MRTINNSLGKPNYSQRLNPDDPSTPWNETMETCNVTAAVTALATAGWDLAKLNKGLHERPAMDLLYFMRKNAQCNSVYDWADPKHATPMNEWMDVLAVGISEYIGLAKGSIHLVYAAARNQIYDHVRRGGSVVIHGNFVFTRKDGTTVNSGHYESLAGIQEDSQQVVFSWIVDDPFGDPRTQYKIPNGDNIVLSMLDVDRLIKPAGVGGKDAIFIPKFTA